MSDNSGRVSGTPSLRPMRESFLSDEQPFRVVTVNAPAPATVGRQSPTSEFVSNNGLTAGKIEPKTAAAATEINAFLLLSDSHEPHGDALKDLLQEKINRRSWKGPRPTVTSVLSQDADNGVRGQYRSLVKIRVSAEDSTTLKAYLFDSAED